MSETLNDSTKYIFGIVGSILIMLGTIFPSLFTIVLQPKQPSWYSVDVFVQHFHGIQGLPFYFGFLLIGGSLMLLTAMYLLASSPSRPLVGLIFGIVGSAIICINYIIQTTYIPAVVAGYTPDHAVILEVFSMANPASLAWAFEMWGYGFLGLGTWLAASFFGTTGIEKFAKVLFILNGILSLIGAMWTALDLGWVLTPPGYISFGLWNLLYLVLAVVTIRVFLLRKKASE
ncbi:MAG: hypothetical protein JXB50_00115 [Spirochaetes bacterium]|nr:hypothetical protein [Spirochaetota bacterium]